MLVGSLLWLLICVITTQGLNANNASNATNQTVEFTWTPSTAPTSYYTPEPTDYSTTGIMAMRGEKDNVMMDTMTLSLMICIPVAVGCMLIGIVTLYFCKCRKEKGSKHHRVSTKDIDNDNAWNEDERGLIEMDGHRTSSRFPTSAR